jgi:eukaryotic-like serine/threonine-protein kinase
MKVERFKQIDEIFDAALELPPSERQAYLEEACKGDAELRKEVESLLKAFDKAEHFIESPALEVAAKSLAEAPVAQLDARINQTFGHYKIISLLGAGGMGEVYLAEDSRLGRKVALKFLPAHFTKDTERVQRFKREARAASALNHPNILTIYEIGQEQEHYFIATEFIEGHTIHHYVNSSKMRMRQAVDVAMQIAGALSAAHTAGIIHRDIKPHNIMLRNDGYVKVLDFGLAKLTERGAVDTFQTMLSARTDPGRVMGTISYMSPEQALGQEVDPRTDIFSLGVVLYEMLTGSAPFKGNSAAAVFDEILNKKPDPIGTSNAEISLEFERIINRALEKDREVRYQTASDMHAELKLLQRNLDSGVTNSASSPNVIAQSMWLLRRGVWSKAALGAVLLAVVALAAWFLATRLKATPPTNWADARTIKITDLAGTEMFPSLAPDGKSLIYVSRISGNYDIYSKRIGAKKADNLTEGNQEEDTQPAFSADGKRIAFRSSRDGGGIFIMTETGESPQKLVGFGFNPAWSPDSKEIVCAESSVESSNRLSSKSKMWIVNTTTGESRVLTESDAVQPSWSPNNKRIAYWGVHEGSQRDIWTISTKGGDPVAVTNSADVDFNPVWSPDGRYLYFISNRKGTYSLWRVEIDEASGKVLGEPELVPLPSVRSCHMSFSMNGKQLVFVQITPNQNAQRFAFDPVAEKIIGPSVAVTNGSTTINAPAISPDGSQLVYTGSSIDIELFVLKIGSFLPNRITENMGNNLIPRWSPDGKQIAAYSNQNGAHQIYIMNSDGSGRQQITEAGGRGAVYPIWSPVDKRMAYSLFGGKTYIMDLSKPFNEQTLHETPFFPNSSDHFVAWDWSPDGKYLSGVRGDAEGTGHGIYLYSLETGEYEKISDFGRRPVWLNDNRRLLFTTEEKLYIVHRDSKKTTELFSNTPFTLSGVSITKDNRTFYLASAIVEADVWLLTLE